MCNYYISDLYHLYQGNGPIMSIQDSLREGLAQVSAHMDEQTNSIIVRQANMADMKYCCIESPKRKVEENCPSCGAPITGDKCEYCGRYHYL